MDLEWSMGTIEDEQTAALLDGRYRLEECVGRGGTALVYRAEDTALGRTVAIKVLRQPDEMPTSMERARGESAVLATLNHRSLVTLYDARLEPGHPQYMVMEYVHGPTLAARLVHGPLSLSEAAALAHDIGSGLQTVHEAGVIHRDVKPSNILMSASTHASREWTAKLADFGIAFGVDDPRLTSPGIAVGTAAYMAPEQVRSEPLTPAVDVYSLGLVLIEAITGEPAFPMTGGVQTALRRLTGPPTLPESLDAHWRELLQHMTRAEPSERPTARDVAETAAAFATAAPRVAPRWGPSTPADAGTSSADDPTPTREYPVAGSAAAATGTRRRRVAAGGIAAAAIASIITLAGAQSMSVPAETPEQTVVLEPATSSPAPVVETAQPDPQRASTAVTGGADSGAGKSPAKAKGKPGKAAPQDKAGPPAKDKTTSANPDKGPGKGPGSGDKTPPKGPKN
ncbi:serine/threonine-protein kinase [Microbacterium sp. MAHUQ-60]|uniref:serine/threonine-protein kinase n=1 Tax=unclassified Microbacterium TaxID=2609290 RepID=UPI00361D9855